MILTSNVLEIWAKKPTMRTNLSYTWLRTTQPALQAWITRWLRGGNAERCGSQPRSRHCACRQPRLQSLDFLLLRDIHPTVFIRTQVCSPSLQRKESASEVPRCSRTCPGCGCVLGEEHPAGGLATGQLRCGRARVSVLCVPGRAAVRWARFSKHRRNSFLSGVRPNVLPEAGTVGEGSLSGSHSSSPSIQVSSPLISFPFQDWFCQGASTVLSYESGICFLYVRSLFHSSFFFLLSFSHPKWGGNRNLAIGCASASSSRLF